MKDETNLLTPITIGDIEYDNRVVLAPLTRGRATEKYNANYLIKEYYMQRASAGLIISEGMFISLAGRGWYEAPEMYTDAHVEAWRPIVDDVHSAGGRMFCQLWHTGRASHSSFRSGMKGYEGDLAKGLGPSAIKRKSHGTTQQFTPGGEEVPLETPREMTIEDIDSTVEDYRNAAEKAKAAGFDGVEIHSANGYLLDEFLQSVSNTRDDEYGGSFENRFRIIDRVINACLSLWNPTQIGIRLSPNSSFNGMGSADVYDSFLYYAEQIDTFNLAYLHVLVGENFTPHHGKDRKVLIEDYRKVYTGRLIVNVGFTKETGNEVIGKGLADMVSFARLFMTNPDLVERFRTNAPLNENDDPTTWFTTVNNHPGARGYTDFPTIEEEATL